MEWKHGKIDVSMRSLQMDQLHTKPNKFVELRHSQSVFFLYQKELELVSNKCLCSMLEILMPGQFL